MAKASKMNRGFTGVTSNHPDTTPKLVRLSGGHAFANFIPLVSFCGQPLSGWKYGSEHEIVCKECGTLYEADRLEKEASKNKR